MKHRTLVAHLADFAFHTKFLMWIPYCHLFAFYAKAFMWPAWNSYMSSQEAIYRNGRLGYILFGIKETYTRKQKDIFTVLLWFQRGNLDLFSFQIKKIQMFSWCCLFWEKQSKCRCIIFSLFVTKILTEEINAPSFCFTEQTDASPNNPASNLH